MNWEMAITRNHALLLGIIAELFAMLRRVGVGSSDVSVGPGGSLLSVGCADTSPRQRGEVEVSALGLTSPRELDEIEQTTVPLTSHRERGSEGRARPVARLGTVSRAQPTERGLPHGQSFTLPRHLYSAIMLILRPCESAIRRLIIIAARGLVLKPHPSQPVSAGVFAISNAGLTRAPRFQLIDPLKQFDPDLWDQNIDPASLMQNVEPFNAALAHQQAQRSALPVNATLLLNRLRAMRLALNDLPRQARRLARWQARQDLAFKSNTPYKPMRLSPFRPGPPPGYRRKDIHQVDSVLKDVHYFAIEASRKDTS